MTGKHDAAAERKRGAARRVSAHTYGRAVDISSIGGIPVIGNQQPGGIVDRAVREILSLPAPESVRDCIRRLQADRDRAGGDPPHVGGLW